MPGRPGLRRLQVRVEPVKCGGDVLLPKLGENLMLDAVHGGGEPFADRRIGTIDGRIQANGQPTVVDDRLNLGGRHVEFFRQLERGRGAPESGL